MPDLFEQLKQKYQGWTTALDSGCVVVGTCQTPFTTNCGHSRPQINGGAKWA
jgi:hypothetical protein